MAQLRPGSVVGEGAKVGNFVEMKNSTIGKKVGLSHLSYLGDAEVGSGTNIGCGFITCNYDGANKHKTVIGENSFIGSDCQMIAPVEIGNNAYVGSGSTINKNVPDDAFAIARERQVTKEGMAKKFIKTKKK
jgi:bifunctional UDP-N-acetylglucosamine pyrophosphorylase/glucosamine-1-phosphate N-acetyltransferase